MRTARRQPTSLWFGGFGVLCVVTLVGNPMIAGAARGSKPLIAPVLSARPLASTKIELSWNDLNTNETGYTIDRLDPATKRFQFVATTPKNATTYSDTGLAPAATYTYRVRTVGRRNTFSRYSNVATAQTPR